RDWARANGFKAEPGSLCFLPGPRGGLRGVAVGLDADDPWGWAALPGKLPPGGVWRIDGRLSRDEADWAAFAWMMGTYAYSDHKTGPGRDWPSLVWPAAADRAAVARLVEATILVRDLINAPASHMGPEELAAAAQDLAARHAARCRVVVGDALLNENWPAVHAVGRASDRAPRLIDLRWGDEQAPRVTLVGKGVCFDSGGLDIKPSSGMKLMKKDMGGAAHALGLAHMVMAAKLPVRLRVLIPAVENAVSGRAMRPLDVIGTRKGITVEIGNTDAEGRLILCDALAEADGEKPALLLDMATLTGAARVALGTELPALFSNDDKLAEDILRHGRRTRDPLWRLPLWAGYRRQLDSKVADLSSISDSPFAGAVTAALFLQDFVSSTTPWAHIDMMAWNGAARPGRPEGGEAMCLRALFALIAGRHG
ncbi:MAG: leucyl aminopeptidase family protein, partial [Alphaproteobacteria bacterium]|nr:leucyl aminopeptidase family protein [Alphaproteobacteria bacterium]